MNLLNEIEKYKLQGRGYFTFQSEYKMTPKNYFEYAKNDFISKSDHSLINTLSNCKRALHLQIDLISHLLCYDIKNLPKNSFPKKIDYCSKLGIVTPKILNKINRNRNLMEHEYVIPNVEELEDFIDVVELFIEATNKYIFDLPDLVELALYDYEKFGNFEIGGGSIWFNPIQGDIKVRLYRIMCDKEKIKNDAINVKNEMLQLEENKKMSADEIKYYSIETAIKNNFISAEQIVNVTDEDHDEWLRKILKIAFQ